MSLIDRAEGCFLCAGSLAEVIRECGARKQFGQEVSINVTAKSYKFNFLSAMTQFAVTRLHYSLVLFRGHFQVQLFECFRAEASEISPFSM